MADVTLPQLGETVTEGTITQWFKQVGDSVAADEALFEVSTDKVDTEVPSPVAGTLTEIRVQEGETVDVGTVIAVVGDGDGDGAPAAAEPPAAEDAPAEEPDTEQVLEPEAAGGTESPEVSAPEPAPASADGDGDQPADTPAPEPEPEPAATPSTSAPTAPSAAKGILLSPVVRRLVNEHGLDPSAISGTGPGGRITRDD
ncbi:MAG: biotin/lipoyl-containing protein, partial [Ilumatobacteraceae bacterium]